MATFITKKFLENIKHNGRLLEAVAIFRGMSKEERQALPRLPKLTSWECVLEEVIDTDHDQPHYVRFVNELLERGYTSNDIQEMRLIAWETAGWFNFEMLAWDWCQLTQDDMIVGLTNRYESGDITKEQHEALLMRIAKYETPPNPITAANR